MKLLLSLLLLQAPAIKSSDTTGLLRSFGALLRGELAAPITVQLDTVGCEASDTTCASSWPRGVADHPLVDTLLASLGSKGRRWDGRTPQCSTYRSGPFNILIRPPRFTPGGATIVVSRICSQPGSQRFALFAKSEEFEFRFDGKWNLVGRRLLWIT